MIGIEDEDFGHALKAFVVLGDGKDASEDDLKKHVKSNLAATRRRRRSSSSTSFPATRPARCSSASSEEKEAEKPGREVQSA